MTQLRCDGQACGGIALAIAGTAAHRRRLTGQLLVAVVGVLVPQAVRCDPQGCLRDAEAAQDVVEAVGVLRRGAAGSADVLARRHRLQGALQQGLLLGRELDRARAKFGMLFQGSALFDSLPIWRNVTFALTQGRMRDDGGEIDMDATPDEVDHWAIATFRDGDGSIRTVVVQAGKLAKA